MFRRISHVVRRGAFSSIPKRSLFLSDHFSKKGQNAKNSKPWKETESANEPQKRPMPSYLAFDQLKNDFKIVKGIFSNIQFTGTLIIL